MLVATAVASPGGAEGLDAWTTRTRNFWDRLVRDLEIPPDLREHIENMAEREDETPWGYILLVLRRDADRSIGSRDRRN